ncbi:glycoside hydrolase family 3 N-terminal domain-containing protein [Nocardioides sp. GXQ0305]|uniref:glycoside hydrolase family 3 N-terminal domain-containing protein n=1 Tax=Nocardioides sp. GXQ0305 TaxID=3423912 RepID=UPI003D7ECA33
MPALARSRLLGVLTVLLLAATGCQGDDDDPATSGGDDPPADATASGEAETPGPADELALTPGWGPTEAELDAAARQVERLPLPALAGQVIVASWSGTAAPVRMVRDLHLGGVVAFDENLTSPARTRSMLSTLRRKVDRPWPLFLSVDQEGGIVERAATTPFPAFMSAGAAGDEALTTRVYRQYGAELAGLGFTVDFAPVADVTSGPDDPTIGSRSPGSDPRLVGEQAVAAAEGLGAGGVVPVLKHFPGHGSVPADSHLELPVQQRSLGELRRVDLAPFATAIDAGAPALMTGHLDVRAVSPRKPSSLSRKVTTRLLRRELGFDGLVVTDSLQMAAVTEGRDPGEVAVKALRAGNDVLLMPTDPAAARAAIVRAVRQNDLPRFRLLQAAARQVALLEHASGRSGTPVGSARDASRELSAAAVTVASGPCRGRVVDGAVVATGDAEAAAAFGGAARAAGLEVLSPRTAPDRLASARPRPERGQDESASAYRQRLVRWRAAERRRRAALADWRAAEARRLSGATTVAFAGYGDGPVSAEVAVATDTPYVLAGSDAPVRIATYGTTAGAMSALVDVLTGEERAPGRLPVDVADVERPGC